jgi:stage III sporulation protein AB
MFLEFVGIIFVLASTITAGFYYGNIETYRIYDLIEMKRALSILKSEIEFSMVPLPEAFINIANRTKSPIDKIFNQLGQLANCEENNSISDIWECTITNFQKDTYFNKEDVEQLISFGKTLGYLDKGMQITSIETMTGYIDEKINLLNKTRFGNRKMYRSLGVLGGVLVVIIFI